MKTREEVEKLKQGWRKHPCWDIETTDGYEEYHDELLEYRKQCEKISEQKARESEMQYRKKQPAYPSVKARYGYDGEYLGLEEDEPGMSLRDYTANKVAPIFLEILMKISLEDLGFSGVLNKAAEDSYRFADIMIHKKYEGGKNE